MALTEHKSAKPTAELLQAIAEPSRIRIVESLLEGPKNVGEIAKAIKAEIVNTSHHLGVMRTAGLVEDRKDGRFVIYSLNSKCFNAKTSMFEFGWCKIAIGN